MIALGGGAVETRAIREALRERATTVLVEVDVETAWQRVSGSDRPLAQDEARFRELYERRQPLYEESPTAGRTMRRRRARRRWRDRLGHAPGRWSRDVAAAELVADERVLELHPPPVDARMLTVPPGERAKTVATAERLWRELRLDRSGTLVAFGGGCTTDVAGLRRGHLPPRDRLDRGADDARRPGRRRDRRQDRDRPPRGKNLVGAFHWPVRTVIDPALLETLPEEQRREGLAEVVKTGLLAGERLWELPDADVVRRCAAFKTALCLRDPYDHGPRRRSTSGTRSRMRSKPRPATRPSPTAARSRSGCWPRYGCPGRPTDAVEEVLAPQPRQVDRDRAWEALQRDKKSTGGELTLVLLGDEGGFTAKRARDRCPPGARRADRRLSALACDAGPEEARSL